MKTRTSAAFMFAIIGFALIAVLSAPAQEKRYALVIGNGNYTELAKLKNPVNDARDIAVSLKGIGFAVDQLLNADLPSMESAVVRLGNRLSEAPGSIGFFFYAGHGVQSNGVNYLIPVDARIAGEAFLKTKALAAQSVLDTLQEARNGLNIVVLDACRDNPFGWARSGTRGLAVVGVQPPGSIVVYATSAGSTAKDGTGRNGTFTSELLKHLRTPGLEVKDMFNRACAGVKTATNSVQIPAVYNQFFDSVYLAGFPAGASGGQTAGATPVAVPERPDTDVTMVEKTHANMVFVQGGTFTMGSPPNEAERDENEVQHKVSVGSFSMAKYETTVGEFRVFAEATGYKTSAEIFGGATVLENDSWTEKSGASWRNPGFSQGNNEPIVCVSWYDAVAFCNWKSNQEKRRPVYSYAGKGADFRSWPSGWNTRIHNEIQSDWSADGYRLPTEAEWEYAARASNSGPKDTVYAGSDSGDEVGWHWGNSEKRTHAVGQKKANEIGLYDMSGNAWEWCWDWYDKYSSAAQTSPTGPSSGRFRVLRGGGWSNELTAWLRVAIRFIEVPLHANSYYGFRICISSTR